MTEAFKVVIPARYGSTRLKGKLLQDIGGKPLLQHAYESAINSEADDVIIATVIPSIFSATPILSGVYFVTNTLGAIESEGSNFVVVA